MNKDEITNAIKSLHAADPANIETEAIYTDNLELLETAIDEFGSLGEAVRAAGIEFFFEFEFNGLRLRSGRVEVARALLDWTEHHGPVSKKALKKTAPELLQVSDKLFGSLARISSRLGLPLVDKEEPPAPVSEAATEPVATPAKKTEPEAPKIIEVAPPVDDDDEEDGEPKKLYPLEPAIDGGKVECKVCGKTFKRLGLHLSRTHGLGVDEYQTGNW